VSRTADPPRLQDTPAAGLAFPGLDALIEALRKPAARVHLDRPAGSSKALAAAKVRLETGAPILYLTPDEERADAARGDLELLLGEKVAHLAEHESAPYEAKPPHTETAALRLETLARLAAGENVCVTASVKALVDRVPSPALVREKVIVLEKGTALDVEELFTRLTYLGYTRSAAVEEVGDYAARGGIVDVYSLGGTHPIRLEIDFDEIVSIREFDVHTQRSVRSLKQARVLPRYELLLDPERVGAAVDSLRATDPEAADDLRDAFENHLHPEGIERAAGRLGQDLGAFFRFLPANTVVFLEEPALVRDTAEDTWSEAGAAYDAVRVTFPLISPPEALFLSPQDLADHLNAFSRVTTSELTHDPEGAEVIRVHSARPDSFGRRIDLWRDYLGSLRGRGFSVTIFCDNDGQKQRLQELLVDEGIDVRLELGVLAAGFLFGDAGLAVLTDHEFFGRARRRAGKRRFRSGFGLKELQSLRRGSFVVHVEHGIGRYVGIARITVNGHVTDVLEIHYAQGDKLYVPVDQLDLIQRYSSEEGKVPVLSRLGGTGWSKTKSKAKRAIQEMAGELLRTYALRKAHPGHAFGADTVWQRELEGSFPYDETPDQLKAMVETKTDMETPSPMDRLICGDVGYGKTEVAVRAAFKAVMDGKQVAVLVPTTILAEQHWNTFRERFAEFPVKLDMMSRFRTPAENKMTKHRLAEGELDLVIGTHALLAKDVRFKNLGLIVVDEEQRFGVAHKERLRNLKTSVDVLTLTATPIPRTLNLSLLGARDITIIQTAPQGRMPVDTQITDFDRDLIQEALLREADRGGQSFFVHNRVHSIHSMANYLRKLCPMLRIGVGHGQMTPTALEAVMVDFIQRKLDVLVATMIIENGLDIPSVNTMIVNRADAFGLAQLYQLRGRVGRSTQKAYCEFLVPARRSLTENAMKRLRAIAEFDELGSGFALAMRDLEIRGAGNILGREQSGFLVSVGFEMYCRLLDEAVRELKGLPADDRPEPRLSTDLDAFLPDDYVGEAEEKVAFYKRLADAREVDAVDTLEEELRDRFGRLAVPAEALFDLRRARILGSITGLTSITLRHNKIELELASPPTPQELRQWMQRIRHPVEFAATGRFVLKAKGGVEDALGILAGLAGTPHTPRSKGTE